VTAGDRDPARVPADTYTHGHHESVLRSHRWRTAENSAAYLLPELTPGRRVLDVGCGPGTITLDIARLVAPAPVVAIDRAAGVLDAARADARAQGVTNVTYDEGDVYALAFADASFDVVHAHQVLQHLTDPVTALAEMRRVCGPSGVVAARDSDYAAFTWYPDDADLTRWLALYHDVARANRAEPDAGRRLAAWARRAGFTDVRSSASVWCFATPEDRAWWGGMWADRVVESAFAEQALAGGFSTPEELARLSSAWRRFRDSPDGWFAILHGEMLCRG
jgi:ubiquinone/menaquinone biosynthesis C-methylase UbiE